MKEDIYEPSYWQDRLEVAKRRRVLHDAVFLSSPETWYQGIKWNTASLARCVEDGDSILDVGCGWGRLLSMLPETWKGTYCGIDVCPDFIEMAREHWPDRTFLVGNVLTDLVVGLPVDPAEDPRSFDWAVLLSFKGMVIKHKGQEEWEAVERWLRKRAKRILVLEYQDEQEEVL